MNKFEKKVFMFIKNLVNKLGFFLFFNSLVLYKFSIYFSMNCGFVKYILGKAKRLFSIEILFDIFSLYIHNDNLCIFRV